MHQESNRPRRVGHLLQREVAGLIQREVNDPRVQHVTIISVDVSPDLKQARVYFTCLDAAANTIEVEKVLNNAKGYLRHHLKTRLSLRSVPHLRFIYDESVERGAQISELIDRALHRDDDPKE
ncbi:MAG: 30S ribosome-binding factor RbfA [Acidiferrobacterales bacterium]